MQILRGIPVSQGVALGPALVLDSEGFRIPQQRVGPDQVESEIQRLRVALKAAGEGARATEKEMADQLGRKYGAIFAAHAMLFEDPSLIAEVDGLIRKERFTAEYAVSRAMREYVKVLQGLGDQFFTHRSADLFDVEKRILHHLLGDQREAVHRLTEPVVILAVDLSPSETAALDSGKVFAFATEHGGRASHTAIIANAMEIPAVVGLGNFLADVSGGDFVIVDGTHGLLILDPDAATIEKYQNLRNSQRQQASRWVVQRDLPPQTKDGVRIMLFGNIEFPSEADHCQERGADGVGLYRTEFLYVGRKTDPTEDEHFQAYMTVLKKLGNQSVVIRTLDVGADKFGSLPWTGPEEKNPYLGMRSIRLCLRNWPLFKTQLRAILRASAFGDIRVMFPMVSTLQEIRECKFLLAEVKEDLQEDKIAFNKDLPVGTMIEVPSAALMADSLAREVDFFSIGTNDLVQYTLAADRTNELMATLYTPSDPAVLRLIHRVVQAADNQGIEVNVCGEMSGDPIYTMLLLGLGLRQLSVTPQNLPEIKKIIRLISLDDARRVAAEALNLETARDVTNYLRDQTRRILPEAVE
ncbi:MAG: phosphoenolpyruvate--protein phosphotransferase [Planctomycetes bacterium]|nr:phosphoenolpyruvate--protein phosphotransferase [Planctomycetota bacterium]